MANPSGNNKRVRPGWTVFWLLMSLALSVCLLLGLMIWGLRQPSQARERPAEAVKPSVLSVFEGEAPVSNPAPLPAETPGLHMDANESGYDYDEILTQEEGFLLARIQGKRYKGFLAVIDDPMRLTVGTSGPFGENFRGKTLDQMADSAGAVLAINGGGFSDDNGNGNGGTPIGTVIKDGELLWGGWGGTVGIDVSGKMLAETCSSARCEEAGLRWALSYGPTLIVNGEVQSLDNSLQEPRTAVGQREDGSVVLITLSGRQAAALGVTTLELANIMSSYGCVNAGNLDGGASSYIYYNGAYLNIPNTVGSPRPIPTCVLVMPSGWEG